MAIQTRFTVMQATRIKTPSLGAGSSVASAPSMRERAGVMPAPWREDTILPPPTSGLKNSAWMKREDVQSARGTAPILPEHSWATPRCNGSGLAFWQLSPPDLQPESGLTGLRFAHARRSATGDTLTADFSARPAPSTSSADAAGLTTNLSAGAAAGRSPRPQRQTAQDRRRCCCRRWSLPWR